ncbi:MAG: alpha/beta fold hydrolase [Rhodospirillales bacterium]|nr:MAG: alpha/beta fold hydrolase [Rhodospirillales bacterium]
MREIVFNGALVRYRTWGEGAAVALLHSGGSSSAQWERIAPALAPVRTVIAPDLLGFGATEAWPAKGALTHDLQADMVAEVVRAAIGAGAIDIVGHSYGGATATRLALRHPELVRSLVLIEPVISHLLRDAGDPLYPASVEVAHLHRGRRRGAPRERLGGLHRQPQWRGHVVKSTAVETSEVPRAV